MEAVLQTYGLCKGYRRFTALEHVNMTVPKGAIYGLVGKNGAGKTTLIRVICGLQEPTAGDYSLYGARLGDKALHRARRRMGAVVETPSLYPDMTAEQNLKLQYRVLGLPEDQGIGELLELVGLSNTGKKKAGHFSLGMKQRLGIAIALCGDPDFLVLDEPTNGLDPQGIVEMRELILQLNRERQITVLISSHIWTSWRSWPPTTAFWTGAGWCGRSPPRRWRPPAASVCGPPSPTPPPCALCWTSWACPTKWPGKTRWTSMSR